MSGNTPTLKLELEKIDNVQVLIDEDLSKFSTLKLRATGDLILVRSFEALKAVISLFKGLKKNYNILGFGANQMLLERSQNPYIKLQFSLDSNLLNVVREEYCLPASIHLSKLTSHASKHGLKGWEVFTGIPATLGGAIFMNAGTGLGEIGSLVKEVKIISKDGELRTISPGTEDFSYRKNNFTKEGDIIYEATLVHKGIDSSVPSLIKEYLKKRNESQPLWASTCGCIFKNAERPVSSKKLATCRAGEFIDIMGLKGFQMDQVRVSPLHANFMENRGGADHSSMVKAITFVKEELKLQFGVDFETEVKF